MSSKVGSTDNKAFQVSILGASLDTGNMGVSALAASLVNIILNIRPNAKISFLIGNKYSKPQELIIAGRKIQIKVVNHRLSPKARLSEHLFWIFLLAFIWRILPFKTLRNRIIKSNPWLNALEEAGFIGDIRGGDSFSDIYGLNGFLLGSIPRIIVLLLKKQLVLLPQTYGPYNSIVTKIVARYILKHSSIIYSRDKKCIETIRKLLKKKADSKEIHFCPDVAFILDTIKPEVVSISPPIKQDTNDKLIGFNINALLYNGGYTGRNMFGIKFDYKAFVYELIKKIMKNTSADILIVPHHFGPAGQINNDHAVCVKVMEYFSNKNTGNVHMVMGEYNQNEVKSIIGLCDFFIGSRMHSCIAALSQNIPTIGVAYSKKFIGVFDSVGLGQMVIDARSVEMDLTIKKILAVYGNEKKEGDVMIGKVKIAQSTIKRTFQQLFAVDTSQFS